MRIKANGLRLKTSAIIFLTSAFVCAGILESIDKELTQLVKNAESFLVTVEAEDQRKQNLYVGSGVLIDTDGYVVTTISVIGNNDDIKVTFKNNESYPAELVGIDNQSGIALLKIEPVDRQIPGFGYPYQLDEGAWMTVIGNSYEMPVSVNFGVFSGITDKGLLQLSVQSSPGSSGSAVFNTKGEVVGILIAQTTETASLRFPYDSNLKVRVKEYQSYYSGKYSGLGVELPSTNTSLAVGIDKIQRIVSQLKEYGEVRYGFLGIMQRKLKTKELKKHNIENGVLITKVIKNSPAEKAGLQEDDIILKVNDKVIESMGVLYTTVRSHEPDDVIDLEILRDSLSQKITVTLSEIPYKESFGFLDNMRNYYDEDVWVTAKEHLKGLEEYLENVNKNLKTDTNFDEFEEKLEDLEKYLENLSEKITELSKRLEKIQQ